MMRLNGIRIQGYRPFGDFSARFRPLEVIVGTNGSGKTALFEFLKFLRDSTYQEIPPEIVPGSIGQAIFHVPGPERFEWNLEMDFGGQFPLSYEGELIGPIGNRRIDSERLVEVTPEGTPQSILMEMKNRTAVVHEPDAAVMDFVLTHTNLLTLYAATTDRFGSLFKVREYVSGWRFYSAFRINHDRIRNPVPIEQEPMLREDAGNLSAVLFYFFSEHPKLFDELQAVMRWTIPGFKGLSVKARGRGEIMAYWQENSINDALSLTDLSDGILRMLCWTALCLHPSPPLLICIDEPDLGLHPRTLPILAGQFTKASLRTQILLATHASYFLTQFELEDVGVMRRVNGESEFVKPADSNLMRDLLSEFGTDEIIYLHYSDMLESMS